MRGGVFGSFYSTSQAHDSLIQTGIMEKQHISHAMSKGALKLTAIHSMFNLALNTNEQLSAYDSSQPMITVPPTPRGTFTISHDRSLCMPTETQR